MEAVPVGKGMLRATVGAKAKRERLAGVPGVRVEGKRVYFPEGLYGAVKGVVDRAPRKREEREKQGEIQF